MPSRRSFLHSLGLAGAALAAASLPAFAQPAAQAPDGDHPPTRLDEFSYGDVTLLPGPGSSLAQQQFEQTQSLLMTLDEDSLLKPFRLRAGLPAPGPDMGGWYDQVPGPIREDGHGFAPAETFGQWISALCRGYAITGDPRTRARVQRLLDLYAPTISPLFYKNFRFPAYDYDKMVLALTDAHRYAHIPDAFQLLDQTTDAALPWLPPHALDRGDQTAWRASIGEPTTPDFSWDESYTMPENLWIAADAGAGDRYRRMAPRYLLDSNWFDPLSEGRNVLPGHHAYSFCNSLSSALRTYLATGNDKYLRAGSNGFDMIDRTQSFATGGWGPDEAFVHPASGKLAASLTSTHHSFETPCGSYAHFKMTRYLLRITGDGRYGD